MRLSTREDIAAPIDFAFARASDFENFALRAMREGASVTRRDAGPVVVGAVWDVSAVLRSRPRHFVNTLTAFNPPDGYLITTEADGLNFLTRCDLVALSPTQTRVKMTIDITARTLTGRLLLQSLKLAKSTLTGRFKSRMRNYATGIEDDYRKTS